jgi:hypothetical protein
VLLVERLGIVLRQVSPCFDFDYRELTMRRTARGKLGRLIINLNVRLST